MTPNPWMILPFVVLLSAIALGPLLAPAWWLKHYAKVALALGAVTLAYYLIGLHGYEAVLHALGVRGVGPDPAGLHAYTTVLHTAHEYISFIALIGALFVVAGGIHISVKGEATPLANCVFLGIGAVIANVLGTTGASMLMIRPWIRMNKYRITAHHIVFFIFIVSNVGGCLTPIGDPPLFLGYLKGIPFRWVVEHCWPMWLVGLGILLAMFFVVDSVNYRRVPKQVRQELAKPKDAWRCEGWRNLFFLGIILISVFITNPPFLREVLMLAAALGSYFATPKRVHQANHFNFHPIQEVAILFIGIFATMMPALDWLQTNAGRMGSPTPAFFYWGTGVLSSVLDNAPTYLSFLRATFGTFVNDETIKQVQLLIQNGGADLVGVNESVGNTFAALQKYHQNAVTAKTVSVEEIEVAFLLGNAAFNNYIVAISIGAVFFGANTYIGNGPNFMVKSIAHHQKVHTPSFLGFIWKFTLPYMVPMLVVVWWIFFR